MSEPDDNKGDENIFIGFSDINTANADHDTSTDHSGSTKSDLSENLDGIVYPNVETD